MAETKTGSSKERLVEDAVHDLEELRANVTALTERCEKLEDEARGLNGLSTSYKGWRNQLREVANGVGDEVERFRAKMLGPSLKDSIETSVDDGQVEAVKQAREG